MLVVAVVGGLAGLGFILGDAVQVDDAVAEVDAVAGNADGALDQEEVRAFRVGLEENNDVATVNGAVVEKRCPEGAGGEGDAVDYDVIADEERLLH